MTLLADLPQSIIARLCLHFEPSQVSPNSKIIVEGVYPLSSAAR